MTEEQIRELATMGANMAHLLRTVDQIKEMVQTLSRDFVTKAAHDAAVAALTVRVDQLEEKVDRQSPMTLWQNITRVLAGITALAAVVGLFVTLARAGK